MLWFWDGIWRHSLCQYQPLFLMQECLDGDWRVHSLTRYTGHGNGNHLLFSVWNLDLKIFFFLFLIVGSDKSQCSYTESRNIQYPSLQPTLASITFSIFILLEFRRPMVQSEWTWSCKSQTRSRWVNDELFHAIEFWQQFVHSELFLFPVIVITNDFIVNCPSEVICL